MTLAKRRGWIRLGVALSIAWLLGVALYAAFDFASVRDDLLTSVRTSDPALAKGGWEVVGQETFLTTCDSKEKQVSCSPRVLHLLGLAFLPVALSWIVTLLLVYAVLWIRAGFRGDET